MVAKIALHRSPVDRWEAFLTSRILPIEQPFIGSGRALESIASGNHCKLKSFPSIPGHKKPRHTRSTPLVTPGLGVVIEFAPHPLEKRVGLSLVGHYEERATINELAIFELDAGESSPVVANAYHRRLVNAETWGTHGLARTGRAFWACCEKRNVRTPEQEFLCQRCCGFRWPDYPELSTPVFPPIAIRTREHTRSIALP